MTLWWFTHLKPILRASFQAYWIGTFGVNLQDTCVFNLCRWPWWTANVQAQRFLYQTILCKRHICGLNITLGLRDIIIIWTGWQQRRCPSVRPGIAWEILRSSLWVSSSALVKFQWKTASQGEVIASSIVRFHAYVKVCLFLSLLIEIQPPPMLLITLRSKCISGLSSLDSWCYLFPHMLSCLWSLKGPLLLHETLRKMPRM